MFPRRRSLLVLLLYYIILISNIWWPIYFRPRLYYPEFYILLTFHHVNFRPAYDTDTDTEWQLPEFVLTQFVSPDDEHEMLETCSKLKI